MVHVTSFLVLVLLSLSFAQNDPDDRFGVMIDAGSSGSRIYVFTWKDNPLGLPNVIEVGNFKVSPGISKVPLANIPNYMVTLLAWAKNESRIPESVWADTPVYFKATAGMRLLSPADQNSILVLVRTSLADSGFYFRSSQARVISGQEEGVFGWISVNFLQGYFTEAAYPQSTGALDLGGASAQITFVPAKPPIENHFPIRVNSKMYQLYTYSFLGWGNDQARAKKNDYLIDSLSDVDPCLETGLNQSITKTVGNVVRNVSGAFDYDACRDIITQLMNLGEGPSNDQTIFQEYLAQTPDIAPWVAFSTYVNAAGYAGITSPRVTLQQYKGMNQPHPAPKTNFLHHPPVVF